MRVIWALIVAVVLFAAVGGVRYNMVVAQDDRVAASRRADCEMAANLPVQAEAYRGDPYRDVRGDALRNCNRAAHEATMAERSIAHYILGAWLWGALAGLLGAVLTFKVMGRRRPAPGLAPPAV